MILVFNKELGDRYRIFGAASVQIPLKQWREGENLEFSDSFVSSLPVIQEGMTLSVEIFYLAGLKRQVLNVQPL